MEKCTKDMAWNLWRARRTPEQRVSRAANATIFLGILYAALSCAALLGVSSLAQRGYGFSSLVIALVIFGLGYGIRQGSAVCLYSAIAGFAMLSIYFWRLYTASGSPTFLLRCILNGWIALILCQAITAFQTLRHTRAFPLPISRYGAFFLRRVMKDHKP